MQSVTGRRRGVRMAAAVLAVVTPSVRASPAFASCVSPPAAIVWSSPAPGETNVPTNADLWLLLSGWSGPSRVLRGGVELPPSSLRYAHDLGELAPNTEYRLQIESADYDFELGELVPRALELSFTTGAGPRDADPAAAPGTVQLGIGGGELLSPACNEAVAAQDCFDAGQNTFFVMHPGGIARGWLIERAAEGLSLFDLWPGECGAPRLFLSGDDPPCVRLHGIDAAGALHPGEWSCFAPRADGGAALPLDAAGAVTFAPGEPPGRRDGAVRSVGSAAGCAVTGARESSPTSAAWLAFALVAVSLRPPGWAKRRR